MGREPPERLEAKVGAARLTSTGRKKIEGRWVLTAEGFKKPNSADPQAPKPPELRRVLFHFEAGKISKGKGGTGEGREGVGGGATKQGGVQDGDGWWGGGLDRGWVVGRGARLLSGYCRRPRDR